MTKPRRVVVVGGGFGGAYCARELERYARRLHLEIVVLDRNNYFVFHPLLVEAGTGSLEPRHAVVPLRSFLRRSDCLMAEVTGVFPFRNAIQYTIAETGETRELEYDHLVIAVGSVTRLPDIPGLRQHAFEMKSLGDSVALRDHVVQLVEAANTEPDEAIRRELLHLVVVGGSFTGVEVAGEFHEFLVRAVRAFPRLDAGECRVTLVEQGARILPALDEDLSTYACAAMRRRGVDVLLKESVTGVEARSLQLAGGATLRSRTLVWCAGIAANPSLQSMSVMLDRLGRVICEPSLRAKGMENVWALGDCAAVPGANGGLAPPTAQAAVQEGRLLARNLVRVLRSQAPVAVAVSDKGSLAAIGCRTAVARVFGLKLSGFPAWFLWRTVYLLKMPTLSRKIRVALDWTLDLFFARDIVQLGVHRRPKGP